MCVKANIEMLLFDENNPNFSPMTHLMKVYFAHVSVSVHWYFRKMIFFEMFFYQTFGFNMFSNIY